MLGAGVRSTAYLKIWLFSGASQKQKLSEDGKTETQHLLGMDLAADERPQLIVPLDMRRHPVLALSFLESANYQQATPRQYQKTVRSILLMVLCY